MPLRDKLILALDVPDASRALEIVDRFGEWINVYKVGFELFVSAGPAVVHEIHRRGKKVFLDLKFHDIPATVMKAAEAAVRMQIFMFNVHASGGTEMMRKCRDRVEELCLRDNISRPMIIGVTVLTSIAPEEFRSELCVQHGIKTHVKHLAALVHKAGLDGVVASGHEASLIRSHFGDKFIIVTPGIRPSWSLPDDQKRTMTPREALSHGANFIVMGRGILSQPDPIKAVELISLEVMAA